MSVVTIQGYPMGERTAPRIAPNFRRSPLSDKETNDERKREGDFVQGREGLQKGWVVIIIAKSRKTSSERG